MRPNLYRGAAGVLFGFLLVFVLAASPVYAGGGPIFGFSFNQVTACPGKVIVDYHYQPGQSSVSELSCDRARQRIEHYRSDRCFGHRWQQC